MTTSTPVIKVLIVDDHGVVRAGLQMLVDQDPEMQVTAVASNRPEALAAAKREQPDIIILDIVLGDDNGLSFLSELRDVSPGARVLVLTGLRSPESQRQAMRAGAMGIVLKEHAAEILIKAIKKVHHGEVWLDRSTMGSVLQELSENNQIDPEKTQVDSLTERERQVIALVGEGLKNKQIAARLFISETTVTHHLSSIFSKLAVSDRLELIIYAFRHGLAKLPT